MQYFRGHGKYHTKHQQIVGMIRKLDRADRLTDRLFYGAQISRISSHRRLSTICFDRRFALAPFKKVPVLPNHGIHRFLLILYGFWMKIAPEKASPADGLSRRNIGQIEHRGVRWEQIYNNSARRTFPWPRGTFDNFQSNKGYSDSGHQNLQNF